MRNLYPGLVWVCMVTGVALGACTGAKDPGTDHEHTDVSDTDASDTDVTDTDVADTDVSDTDVSDTDAGDTDVGGGSEELSECALEVLEDDEAYSTCFDGTFTYGACVTCGYTDSRVDCVTCEDGYEIDVVYDDCTGFCVPDGTAVTPLSASDCEAISIKDVLTEECFAGEELTGACETCGYYDVQVEAMNPDDCITCDAGYEIDVVYDDCTGFCVPEGTAIEPISLSDCEPFAECVRD